MPEEQLDLAVGLARVMFPIVILLGLGGIQQAILNTFDEFFVPADRAGGLERRHHRRAAGVACRSRTTPRRGSTSTPSACWSAPPCRSRCRCRGCAAAAATSACTSTCAIRTCAASSCYMLPVTLGLGLINVNLLVGTVVRARDRPRLRAGARSTRRSASTCCRRASSRWRRRGRCSRRCRGYAPPATSDALPRARSARASARSHSCCCRRPRSAAVLAEPIVRVLFQRGEFDAAARPGRAECLAAFSLGLAFNGAMLLLNRAFFSLQRPWVPTARRAGNLAAQRRARLALYRPLGVWGIPLATSISNIVAPGRAVGRSCGARSARSRAARRSRGRAAYASPAACRWRPSAYGALARRWTRTLGQSLPARSCRVAAARLGGRRRRPTLG